MGRPIKEGLSYFALDADIYDNKKVALFRTDLAKGDRLTGFAIFVLLLAKIYGGKGYYIQWDEDAKKLFCDGINVDINLCDSVVNACINRGLFNREKYEEYGILTSSEIQKRFVSAAERRKCIHVVDIYLINDNTNSLSASINAINDSRKYTKEKKRNTTGINVDRNYPRDSSKTCPNGHRYFGDYCEECDKMEMESSEPEEDDIEF